MKKTLNSIEDLFVKSLWTVAIAISILVTTMALPQSSFAVAPGNGSSEKVIQPFEMTNPAATRSEAYDEIAKLNKDPKALIEAENVRRASRRKSLQTRTNRNRE